MNPIPEIRRTRPLKVAWFTYFPVERLPNLPEELRQLPKLHPATWQRVLWEEFKSYPDLQLDIIVLRSHFPRNVSFEMDGSRFHCIRTPGGLRTASLYWLDTSIVARKIEELKPDLVHAWGTEFGAAAIAHRVGCPALVTMQGILEWYGSVFPLNFHQKVGRFLEKRSLPRTRIATVESSFGKRYLHERYPNLKLLQVEHAPNPVFSRVQRTPHLRPPRLVCVGAFLYSKGADIVIKALHGLVREFDFELLWVGAQNEEFERELRSQTSPELWKRIAFKHDLPAERVAEELGHGVVFLHPARADNSPNSVKEAVVAGVPVVATETGGIPDYVFPGKNGLLFPSGSVEGCREQIRAALRHPQFSRGDVDAETLEKVRDYLSAKTMARKFFEAYEATLREFGRTP